MLQRETAEEKSVSAIVELVVIQRGDAVDDGVVGSISIARLKSSSDDSVMVVKAAVGDFGAAGVTEVDDAEVDG